MNAPLLAFAASLGLVACLPGCTLVRRCAASGTVAGHRLQGPVDSALARDYLEGRALPPELEHTRRGYLEAARVPSREELAALSRQYSPDVATILLLETLSAEERTRALRQRFERELAYVRRVGIDDAQLAVPSDLVILFAPGWFYRTHGSENGADFRAQRDVLNRMGAPNELVPMDENGSAEENARSIADAIRKEARHRRVFLVSASKSGAEAALAVGRELSPDEARSVVGWLSIGGVVRGSPFADRVLEPDLCWFTRLALGREGFDLDGVMSMRTIPARAAFDNLAFPAHLRITSYIATPLSGHITKRGEFGYGRMRSLGPNDGLTLLADELIPGATPLIAPGVDHFFQHEEQDLWTAAIFRALVSEVMEQGS